MLACCLSCSIDGISLGEGRARLGGYGGVLHAMTPARQIHDASRWQTSPTNTQSVREWEISRAITSYCRSPLTTPKNAKREMCHVIDILQCVSDETVLGITTGITLGIVYIYDSQISHIPHNIISKWVVRLLGTQLWRATSFQYI